MKTVNSFLFIHVASASASTLRGKVDEIPIAVGTKPPDFNCFHAAWNGENAEGTCSGSRATDSSPCIWCSMDEGVVAGACLSSEEAIAANGKFGLTCPMTMYLKPAENAIKKGIPDINCLKAAWSAVNAESACGESKDNAGESCVWCQTDGDAMGACLSKAEAGMVNGQVGLMCPSNDATLDVSLVSES